MYSFKPVASLVCLLGALLLGSFLGGCGSSDKEPALERIKKQGVLNWGADAAGGAPFVFFDPNDPTKVIGFEMDIMEAFSRHLGIKPQRVQTAWDGLVDQLRSRRIDVIVNGIEINEERKKQIGFSVPYYVYEQQLTVRAEDREKYKSLEDLKGKPVAILSGAEAGNVLKRAGWTSELLLELEDSSTPYQNLEQKKVEAVLQESIIAAHYAGKNEKLYNIPETFSPGLYAFGVRLEDTSLLEEIDRILKLMKENGELATIYKKWNIWNEKQADIGIKTAP